MKVTPDIPPTVPRSGWCPPWRHDSDHKECQRRLDRGLLDRCGCPEHEQKGET